MGMGRPPGMGPGGMWQAQAQPPPQQMQRPPYGAPGMPQQGPPPMQQMPPQGFPSMSGPGMPYGGVPQHGPGPQVTALGMFHDTPTWFSHGRTMLCLPMSRPCLWPVPRHAVGARLFSM